MTERLLVKLRCRGEERWQVENISAALSFCCGNPILILCLPQQRQQSTL